MTVAKKCTAICEVRLVCLHLRFKHKLSQDCSIMYHCFMRSTVSFRSLFFIFFVCVSVSPFFLFRYLLYLLLHVVCFLCLLAVFTVSIYFCLVVCLLLLSFLFLPFLRYSQSPCLPKYCGRKFTNWNSKRLQSLQNVKSVTIPLTKYKSFAKWKRPPRNVRTRYENMCKIQSDREVTFSLMGNNAAYGLLVVRSCTTVLYKLHREVG